MKSIGIDAIVYISEPMNWGEHIPWGGMAGSEGVPIFRRYMDNLYIVTDSFSMCCSDFHSCQ